MVDDWRPVLTLRKDDETAYLNATRYWELSHHTNERTFALRVRRHNPDDFTLILEDEDQPWVVYRPDDWKAYLEAVLANEGYDPDQRPDGPKDLADAEAWAVAHGMRTFPREWAGHWAIYDRLEAYWHALCLLVDPATTL